MNAERLLQHYERIADAPDAIVRLRRFILDLAMRGKLVPQDPKDEPASELLKRIEKEKARLLKAGEIRKREESESLLDSDDLFPLPESWRWISATYPSYIVSDLDKKVQTKDVLETGLFPVVDQGKLFIRGYCNDPEKVIRITEPLVLFGDHTRETKFIDFDFVVGADGVKLLQPIGLFSRYYFLALTWLPLDSRGYGRHFKLLRASRIPLPPLVEQQRIVAKVDELMSLCDQFEVTRTARELARDRLATASLARLNAPDPETLPADASFALGALPALTTRPDQIKQLRQTILNLAVRGKLVPQDPNDEPASELLKRIAKEKARLVKAGEIRRREDLPGLQGEGYLCSLPHSWSWCRFGSLGWTQTGTTPPKAKPENYGDYIPFIKPGDLYLSHVEYGNEGLSERGVAESGRIATPGSILMVCIGTIGKCQLIDRNCSFNQQINSLSPFSGIVPRFLLAACQSEMFQKAAWSASARTTIAILNKGNWELLPFPLPPFAEQRRIVAKVDTLMALCDRLEASVTAAAATRRRLLDALLAEALAPVAMDALPETEDAV